MNKIGNQIILGMSLSMGLTLFAQGHGSHGSTPTPPAAAPSANSFPVSVEGLADVIPFSEVRLRDGDSYTLEAKAVKQKIGTQWIRRLAYNGSVPGPIFRVQQGSRVNVLLKNSTEIDTTLHPHGLRVETRFDGVPSLGQSAIKPGESFNYELSFPDAGVYWYHPHIREDYSQDAGLYGVFIVEPTDSNLYSPVHREIPLVLDDVNPNQIFQKATTTHTLMGSYGTVTLVNGVNAPSLTFKKGEIVRFYALNSANTRVFALAIPGVQFKLVGSDNGFYEKEEWVNKVILGPGERAILEARFTKVGNLSIQNAKPTNPQALAKITVLDGTVSDLGYVFETLKTRPTVSAELAKAKASSPVAVAKSLSITVEMDHSQLPMDMGGMNHGSTSMPGMNDPAMKGIEWDDEMPEMNGASNTGNVVWKLVDTQTKKANMDIQWKFKKGDLVKIRIYNDPSSMHPMQHPIHFHGQRFIVATKDGKALTNQVWKDTVLIPSGSTYDLILEASNPGEWMGHCHISEHLEASMMLGFSVAE